MPELPEVETVRRGLYAVLAGRRIAEARALRPDLRFPLPERLGARLVGRRVEALERRGKYLLLRLDDGEGVIIHLGMSGRLRVLGRGERPPLDRHDHVVIATEDGTEIRFNDARRFGFLAMTPWHAIHRHRHLNSLGPEPLDPAFDGRALAARLEGRRTTLKAALADQRRIAGLGNIYVSEALFWAALSPESPAGSVTGASAAALVEAIRRVLTQAIEAGGSSLRDFRKPDGELGYFQASFAVYDRAGERCPRCPAGARCRVARIVQGGRATYFCPRLQRAPHTSRDTA
jgi:formamidopyrimidine-DNA glycosylase